MSRCFPYPPPGYTLRNSREEALIESIKFQKQKVNAEEQRKKDKKREKKEKKEKRKEEKKICNLDKPNTVQAHIVEKLWTQSKVECKLESEQLERSSLTEEHEKPVSLRVPSTSSDSTENSNKRKRPSSPGDVTHGHGNIIRIRLPSKKQKQSPEEQQPCSTSGRTHFPSHVKSDFASRFVTECCTAQLASKNADQGLVLKIDRQRISPISKQIVKTPVPSTIDTVMTPMKKEELLYKNLTENWVPPQLQNGCVDLDDNDWLLPRKNEEKRRICRFDSISSCSSSSAASWPVATYLPEVDVYALPFTVPF